MKLKNKKTGEIPDKIETIAYIQWSKTIMMVYVKNNGERIVKYYDSLEAFNEEWEDAPEEPKNYWYIDWNGEVCRSDIHDERTNQMKLIGNYFETKEEADKAVERLRAWKRLKDKGFRFDNWDLDADDEDVNILLRSDTYKGNKVYDFDKDLDLLFGGEE